jgi:hypothetical protein
MSKLKFEELGELEEFAAFDAIKALRSFSEGHTRLKMEDYLPERSEHKYLGNFRTIENWLVIHPKFSVWYDWFVKQPAWKRFLMKFIPGRWFGSPI